MALRKEACNITGGIYRPRHPRASPLYQCVTSPLHEPQPLRAKSVTYVSGINCYPCVRYGPNKLWRRERDSNPRYAINVYTLSRRAP